MRCYFVKGGHVMAVEELPGLSEEEAVAQARDLFQARKGDRIEGFEVWDGGRSILAHPHPRPPNGTAAESDANP